MRGLDGDQSSEDDEQQVEGELTIPEDDQADQDDPEEDVDDWRSLPTLDPEEGTDDGRSLSTFDPEEGTDEGNGANAGSTQTGEVPATGGEDEEADEDEAVEWTSVPGLRSHRQERRNWVVGTELSVGFLGLRFVHNVDRSTELLDVRFFNDDDERRGVAVDRPEQGRGTTLLQSSVVALASFALGFLLVKRLL